MISYCITVYKEKDYIKNLLDKIFNCKTNSEEVIVVQTYKDIAEKSEDFFIEIKTLINSYADISYHTYHFQNNFADLKNYLNSCANKSYIFNLDADEDYSCEGFDLIRYIVLQEKHDLYYLPRINTVEGLTREDISKWNWKVNDNGWINWPDFQPRVYKNISSIKWDGSVHEQIIGTESAVAIDPKVIVAAIIHKKDIHKQREQNAFYDSI